MGWRVTVRSGPRVVKLRAATLEEALDLVEREARVLAAGPRRVVEQEERESPYDALRRVLKP